MRRANLAIFARCSASRAPNASAPTSCPRPIWGTWVRPFAMHRCEFRTIPPRARGTLQRDQATGDWSTRDPDASCCDIATIPDLRSRLKAACTSPPGNGKTEVPPTLKSPAALQWSNRVRKAAQSLRRPRQKQAFTTLFWPQPEGHHNGHIGRSHAHNEANATSHHAYQIPP